MKKQTKNKKQQDDSTSVAIFRLHQGKEHANGKDRSDTKEGNKT